LVFRFWETKARNREITGKLYEKKYVVTNKVIFLGCLGGDWGGSGFPLGCQFHGKFSRQNQIQFLVCFPLVFSYEFPPPEFKMAVRKLDSNFTKKMKNFR
jgi:hypothetical protein